MSDNQEDDFDDSDNVLTCAVREQDDGQRLDKLLAERFADLSRSRLKALILEGAVCVNDLVSADPSRKLKFGSVITVNVPPPVDDHPVAQDIPLDILFEDESMLVINKPAGMVVHPGAGNPDGTLVNALLYHCGDTLSGIGGVRRPGIVHRIDKDTSGLMVAAKSDKAHKALSAQLADRTLGRHYKALVWGVPSLKKGFIKEPIGRHPSSRIKMSVVRKGGRDAGTDYEIDQAFGETASLIDCKLESGRTHQIRVHMAHIGFPLLGDPLYGVQPTKALSLLKKGGYEDEKDEILAFPRQALHAWQISFDHPLSGESMEFEAPIPEDMSGLINLFKSAS